MASGPFFYSSPPPGLTLDLWNHSTSAFLTPQQPSKFKWTGTFVPASPSPLRTSRNENLMSSPLSDGDGSEKAGNGLGGQSENTTVAILPQNENNASIFPSFSTGPLTEQITTTATVAQPFSFQNPFAPSMTMSSTTSDDTTTARARANQFQFSARARSSNPSVALQSHAREARDSRKRLFLDRLRSRRDEARTERTGDQVMQMDYMRERREREADQLAMMDKLGWDVNVDELLMAEELEEGCRDDDGEMSPVEEWGYGEDDDVEELARGYYGMQQDLGVGVQSDGGASGGFEEFSDDGYDEVFMEVLSHGQTDTSTSGAGFTLSSMVQPQSEQFNMSTGELEMNMDMDMS